MVLVRFFASSRLRLALLGTRVFFRGFTRLNASCNNETKREIAASLFIFWLRESCEVTRSTPRLPTRVPSLALRRVFWNGVRLSLASTSNSNVTLVSEVLTCCPPGPELRDEIKLISLKGIVI